MRRIIPLFPRSQVLKKAVASSWTIQCWLRVLNNSYIVRCVHEWQPVIIVSSMWPESNSAVDQGLCALVGENKGPIISTEREGNRPSRRYRVSPGLAFPNTNYPSRKPSYLPGDYEQDALPLSAAVRREGTGLGKEKRVPLFYDTRMKFIPWLVYEHFILFAHGWTRLIRISWTLWFELLRIWRWTHISPWYVLDALPWNPGGLLLLSSSFWHLVEILSRSITFSSTLCLLN